MRLAFCLLAVAACTDDPNLGARQALRFTYGPDALPVPQLSISQPVDAIAVTNKDPEPNDNTTLPPDYATVDLSHFVVQSSDLDVADFAVDTLGLIETTLHATGTTSLVIANPDGSEVDHLVIEVQ